MGIFRYQSVQLRPDVVLTTACPKDAIRRIHLACWLHDSASIFFSASDFFFQISNFFFSASKIAQKWRGKERERDRETLKVLEGKVRSVVGICQPALVRVLFGRGEVGAHSDFKFLARCCG